MAGKELKIKFNAKIYKKDALNAAVKAYSHLADFSVSRASGHYTVSINNITSQVKGVLADEFANYVLGLTKRCRSIQ